MAKPTVITLPTAALEHMSPQAQEQLPNHIRSGPNIIWDNPATVDALLGTTGKADVFVFDWATATSQGMLNLIDQFEADLDTIAFINVPPDVQSELSTNTATPVPLANYPQVVDDPAIFNSTIATWNDFSWAEVFVVDAVNPYFTLSGDNSVTLVDGSILVLPPNPWEFA